MITKHLFIILFFVHSTVQPMCKQHVMVAVAQQQNQAVQQLQLQLQKIEKKELVIELIRFHNITVTTPKIISILQEIAKLSDYPLSIVEYLAKNLSNNDINAWVLNAYDQFYYHNGLPKLAYANLHNNISNHFIPAVIGNEAHAQDRVTLYKLMKAPIIGLAKVRSLERAMKYIDRSCSGGACWRSYSQLAQAMANVLYGCSKNEMVLRLADYAQHCPSSAVRDNVVTFVGKAIDTLYSGNISDQDAIELQKSIIIVDRLWKKYVEMGDAQCGNALVNLFADDVDVLQECEKYAALSEQNAVQSNPTNQSNSSPTNQTNLINDQQKNAPIIEKSDYQQQFFYNTYIPVSYLNTLFDKTRKLIMHTIIDQDNLKQKKDKKGVSKCNCISLEQCSC